MRNAENIKRLYILQGCVLKKPRYMLGTRESKQKKMAYMTNSVANL